MATSGCMKKCCPAIIILGIDIGAFLKKTPNFIRVS
jgi:hypothetical protein